MSLRSTEWFPCTRLRPPTSAQWRSLHRRSRRAQTRLCKHLLCSREQDGRGPMQVWEWAAQFVSTLVVFSRPSSAARQPFRITPPRSDGLCVFVHLQRVRFHRKSSRQRRAAHTSTFAKHLFVVPCGHLVCWCQQFARRGGWESCCSSRPAGWRDWARLALAQV